MRKEILGLILAQKFLILKLKSKCENWIKPQ